MFIILPILNEISNIGSLLDQVESTLEGGPFTIGVLDDGSTDGTVEYLKQRLQTDLRLHLICRVKTHHGSQRGAALRTSMLWGLERTSHEIFVEMDGDLSHRPEELPDGIRLIAEGRGDVAFASKYARGGCVTTALGRKFVSWVCSTAVGLLLSPKIRDYSNGYRFYNRRAAQLAAEHPYGYGSPIYLSEVLALWLRSRLRVIEFPTLYIGRNEGVSKLRIIDLVKATVAIFEISCRYHFFGFHKRATERPRALASSGRKGKTQPIHERGRPNLRYPASARGRDYLKSSSVRWYFGQFSFGIQTAICLMIASDRISEVALRTTRSSPPVSEENGI